MCSNRSVNAESSRLELLGSNYNERIRIKNGKVFKIRKGTFIYLSSYSGFALRVLKSADNDAYTEIIVNGVTLLSFLADEDCYCTFSIVSKTQTVQSDTTAAELFVLEYDDAETAHIDRLETMVREHNKRLSFIDGQIDVEWEIGGYVVNQDGSVKHPNPGVVTSFPRIRSKYGCVYFVNRKTAISLSSYSDYRLLIYISADGVHFNSSVSLTADGSVYHPESDVYCIFVIVRKNNEDQTDTSAAALFTVTFENDIQIALERMAGEELIAETTVGKTLAYKFNIVAGHSYRFINLGSSTNTMMLYAGNTPAIDTSTLLERSIGTIQIRDFVADTDYRYIYVYTTGRTVF